MNQPEDNCHLCMYNLINNNERNNMLIRGSDYHSHNIRSKDANQVVTGVCSD